MDFISDEIYGVCEKIMKHQEQKFFDTMKDKYMEEAVLIMHPKHKETIINSGLKCHVVWSSLCPEDTTYMVTDEELKEMLRGGI